MSKPLPLLHLSALLTVIVAGVLPLILPVTVRAEHGFIPEEPGVETYHDEPQYDNSPVRYYYKSKNLEVEVVNDANGYQYAYTVTPYEAIPLSDGMYVISSEIIFPYRPDRYQLRTGDTIMVILGSGKVISYYSADQEM